MQARGTDWRQGDLLTYESALQMGLIERADACRRVVVISHDCDIPHEAESWVELIVADLVDTSQPDRQFSHARHPRRLHLCYQVVGGGRAVLELRHQEWQRVEKRDFVRRAVRDDAASLDAGMKRTLKQWLAARYGRPAFPNAFENRLRKRKGRRTVEQRIAHALAPEASHLVGLFLDLGAQRGVEAADGEAYVLSISVVYDAVEGGPPARTSAEAVAERLRQLFVDAYGAADQASEIALEACEAVADTHFTLADIRRVDQWRLEYMSLDEGQGAFLPVAETPL